jgi:hypothetical protein
MQDAKPDGLQTISQDQPTEVAGPGHTRRDLDRRRKCIHAPGAGWRQTGQQFCDPQFRATVADRRGGDGNRRQHAQREQ